MEFVILVGFGLAPLSTLIMNAINMCPYIHDASSNSLRIALVLKDSVVDASLDVVNHFRTKDAEASLLEVPQRVVDPLDIVI